MANAYLVAHFTRDDPPQFLGSAIYSNDGAGGGTAHDESNLTVLGAEGAETFEEAEKQILDAIDAAPQWKAFDPRTHSRAQVQAKQSAPQTGGKDCVSILSEVLDQAKQGQVLGVVVVAQHPAPTNGTSINVRWSDSGDYIRLYAGCGLASAKLSKSVLEPNATPGDDGPKLHLVN